jgi:hypothetical protein
LYHDQPFNSGNPIQTIISHSSPQQSFTAVSSIQVSNNHSVTNIQQINNHLTQKQPSNPRNYNIQFKAETTNSTQSFSAIQISL